MAFVPVAKTAMVELRYTHLDQRMENTLYFEFATTPSVADLTGLGTALATWWADNIAPLISQNCGLREVFVTDLTSNTSPAVSFVPDPIVFGAQTTDPMPGNVTIAIKFSSAGRGRSSRGRNYIVGLVETDVAGNRLGGPIITGLLAAYNALFDVATAIDVAWVIVSRFTDNAPRVAGETFPVISVQFVDDNVDSQRRRLAGRGT